MAADRKTVIIFGSYAPSLLMFRGRLIEAMTGRRHRVIAVAPDIDAATGAALRGIGAEPREVPVTNQSLNPVAMVRALVELKRLIRRERPDVLIAYTIKPVMVGAFAGSAERVPTIVSMITGAGYAFMPGDSLRHRFVRTVAASLYKAALRRSDWIIFQNRDDESLFQELGILRPGQNVCITNGSGVDLQRFSPVPQPERPSFVMVARLLKSKGVLQFGAAARRLKSEHPDVVIHLVGYIDSSPDSISQTDLKEIEDAGVIVHGKVSDVRPVLSESSVFVLPSYYREGVPRSILEAMAMQRAIITTDAPGCRETVIDGINGFLVPPRDSNAVYEAMRRFVLEPGLSLRMGRESRRLAESRFDDAEVNATIMQIASLRDEIKPATQPPAIPRSTRRGRRAP
jgi:glycosyltransferase involved in cell wall biosynthesis